MAHHCFYPVQFFTSGCFITLLFSSCVALHWHSLSLVFKSHLFAFLYLILYFLVFILCVFVFISVHFKYKLLQEIKTWIFRIMPPKKNQKCEGLFVENYSQLVKNFHSLCEEFILIYSPTTVAQLLFFHLSR